MSIILKSNVVAKKVIASKLAINAPQDFKVAMDFTKERYAYNGVSKDISELLTSTRSQAGGYINNSGEYAVASPSVIRIHNDPYAGKGMLSEAAYTNNLANPSAPATQTITTNIAAGVYFMIQVWGEGSCQVDIKTDAGVSVSSGVATEALPFYYLSVAGITGAKVTVTPNGITHFQNQVGRSTAKKQTKNLGIVTADITTFNNTYLANLLSSRSELTVVVRRRSIKHMIPNMTTAVTLGTVVALTNSTSIEGVFASRNIGLNNLGTLRRNIGAENNSVTNGVSTDDADDIFAVAVNNSGVSMAHKGAVVALPITSGIADMSKLYIGGGSSYLVNDEHIIKELYIYDRKLTDAELLKIAY